MEDDLKLEPVDIERIFNSWQQILRAEKKFGMVFYKRLFELRPELRLLFKNDVDEQADKLMATLTFLLAKIHNSHAFIGDVQHLARRHVGYGVSTDHYYVIGEVLVWSIKELLEINDDEDILSLWRDTYQRIAEVMIRASKGSGEQEGVSNVA